MKPDLLTAKQDAPSLSQSEPPRRIRKSNKNLSAFEAHAMAFIVASLFVLTLIAFVVIICIKPVPVETVLTTFTALLSGLAGFFVGTQRPKRV